MTYWVYILYSSSANKYYIGQTENLSERIEQHNNGFFSNSSTKYGIPWILNYVIECSCRKQALAIERHIKKMKSRKYLNDLKIYPEISVRLKKMYS
ncbi:GIY-YIG nuclease family protein [Rubrolithibacter danxiaensis]|uniref:GIY-YIG nuclease family protein n=1 Tax=Rubrolithibacter danxiaensis TaxID=3390805 RepID=UPI003BF7A8B2